jgi:tRNA-dihydrouridine synthase B
MNIKPDSSNKLILLAPMAGITDKPFRKLCYSMGAHACVSEMTSSNPALYNSRKSQLRMDVIDDESPRIVQIAGADPRMMAEAAIYNVDRGAEVIDINMGCPAKKVCNVMAGSSLLRDEQLVASILESVVAAVSVPVTLKIRTGWDPHNRNAVSIASIAEAAGVQRLAVHGRTRACRFNGSAEHDTVAEIKSRISIPVIANGDINSPDEAARVLHYSGADGVMIGRAALGNPWIFNSIHTLLLTGVAVADPSREEIGNTLLAHLGGIYRFYGEYTGVRIARKHIGWYCAKLPGFGIVQPLINNADSCIKQLQLVADYFRQEADTQGKLAA